MNKLLALLLSLIFVAPAWAQWTPPPPGGAGGGTVNTGTTGQLGYYATTGTAISGSPNITISGGALSLGQATGPIGGSITLYGATSGTVTIGVPAVAGTNTIFNLPGNNGTADYFLQTDGSGNTSWVAASGEGTVTSFAANDLAPWFNTTVATPDSTPVLSFSPTGTKGALLYFSALNTAGNLTVGSTSNFLTVASGLPAWSTNTVPSTDTKGDLWYASANNTISGLGIGSTGQLLTIASGIPAWTTNTYPSTDSEGDILYASASNTIGGLAIGASTDVLTSSGMVPQWSTPGTVFNNGSPMTTQGDILFENATPAPARLGVGTAGALLRTGGASANPSWTTATYPNTATQGQVMYGNGSSNWVGLAAGTAGQLLRTGGASANPAWSTNVFPNTDSAGDLLYASSANTISGLGIGTQYQVLVASATPLPSWGAVNLAQSAAVTGTLPIANGGTNNGSLAVTAGGTLYTDGSKVVNVGAGSSGQFLESQGTSAPIWANSTSSGIGGSGADGTNTDATSTPSQPAAPQYTAFLLGASAAHTYTYGTANTTGGAVIINCTGTFTLGDASHSSAITIASGSGPGGGLGAPAQSGVYTVAGAGAGPGGGRGGNGASAQGDSGGGGGGNGGAGGGGGEATSSLVYPNGGRQVYTFLQGGSGGGGGGSDAYTGYAGGNGGNGGASLLICSAGAVNLKSSTTISCTGQAGASAVTGGCGGAGGSGGSVAVISLTSCTLSGTVTVTGGAGGAGAGSNQAGGGGGGGGGQLLIWSPSNSTGSLTFTATGGTGGSAGSIGSAGANGTTTSAAVVITDTPSLPLLTWVLTTPKGNGYLTNLRDLEVACGRITPNKIINLEQKDVAWGIAKNIQEFCYYYFSNISGTTCLSTGDYLEANHAS